MSESIQYPYLTELREQWPDQSQTRAFLKALDPKATRFTFQCFDENAPRAKEYKASAQPNPLSRILHGTFEECEEDLWGLNQLGAGVYVTVNETDLTGRKKANITRVRAIFQEDDLGTGADVLPLCPCSIEVQSSPGKFHRYWLITDGRLPGYEAKFADLMSVMVSRYASDPNAKDLSRVLRLPGFYHSKYNPEKKLDGTPVLVKLMKPLSGEEAPRFTFDAAFKAFGRPEVEAVHSFNETGSRGVGLPLEVLTDQQKSDIESALATIPADEQGMHIFTGMRLRGIVGGWDIWNDWSKKGCSYNDIGNAELMAKRWQGFTYGGSGDMSYTSIFTLAEKEFGWSNPARGGAVVEESLLAEGESIDSFFDSRVTTVTLDMIKATPRKRESHQGMFPLRCTTALCAQGGVGKTSWLVHKAAEVIAKDGVEVLIISAEDEVEDYVTKIHNLVYTHPYAANDVDLADKFHVMDLRGTGMRLVEGTTIFKPSQAGREISDLIAERFPNVGLIIVETLSRMSGGETNEHFESCVAACDHIAVQNNAAVVLVHHTGKSQAREELNDIYFGRGGSTLGDNTRSFISILKVKQKEADELNLNVSQEAIDLGDVIQVEHVRMAYGPRVPPTYFHIVPGVSNGIVLSPLEAKELTSSDGLAALLEKEKQQKTDSTGKVKDLIRKSGGRYLKRDFRSQTQKKIGMGQDAGMAFIDDLLADGEIEELKIKENSQTKIYVRIPGESADYDRIKDGV